MVGLGDKTARFRVYIGNRPAFADFPQLQTIQPLSEGDIHDIGLACGNGWRKVFNVYAKLVFALQSDDLVNRHGASRWQDYRDSHLLQQNSNTALLFSPPNWDDKTACHIVMGKHYGMSLSTPREWHWPDAHFAVLPGYQGILCPYFDYRQLTNARIETLVQRIQHWSLP